MREEETGMSGEGGSKERITRNLQSLGLRPSRANGRVWKELTRIGSILILMDIRQS